MTAYERTTRAIELLDSLTDNTELMKDNAAEFVTDMYDRWHLYGDALLVSDRQLEWLEDLHREHC